MARKVGDDWYAIYKADRVNDDIFWAVYVNRKQLGEMKTVIDGVLMNLDVRSEGERAKGSVDSPPSPPGSNSQR